jgi:bifunctional non-homologous end joining protein LigD
MLAVEAPAPFDSPDFWYEAKWDGLRCIAYVEPERVRLQSRNLRDLTGRYPAFSRLGRLFCGRQQAVLDGELLGFADGRPSFQAALRAGGATLLVAFDLLHLDGRDMLAEPLEARRRFLAQAFEARDELLIPSPLEGQGVELYRAAREHGLEGVMAKRLGSRYLPGVRSRDWQKFVVRRSMECVILGVTAGSVPATLGGRPFAFGSLLVGAPAAGPDGAGGRWAYLGNVGTGWDSRTLASVLGQLRVTVKSPWPRGVAGLPPGPPPRISRATVWVEPQLVAEIAYREVTRDGVLRHPSFLRLRHDLRDGPASDPLLGSGHG